MSSLIPGLAPRSPRIDDLPRGFALAFGLCGLRLKVFAQVNDALALPPVDSQRLEVKPDRVAESDVVLPKCRVQLAAPEDAALPAIFLDTPEDAELRDNAVDDDELRRGKVLLHRAEVADEPAPYGLQVLPQIDPVLREVALTGQKAVSAMTRERAASLDFRLIVHHFVHHYALIVNSFKYNYLSFHRPPLDVCGT